MPTAIMVRPLLGTYTGHNDSGQPELLPTFARVHAALLNAAGRGSTAVAERDGLRPSQKALEALEWLELNPPTGIAIPEHQPVHHRSRIAYRKEGTISKESGTWVDKTTPRAVSDASTLNGPIAWCWHDRIPDGVLRTLDELSSDVGYLGEAISPVILEISEAEPTHMLRADASAFEHGMTSQAVPASGRTRVLIDAHNATISKKPTVSADKHTSTEKASPPPVVRTAVRTARYAPVEQPSSTAPWDRVILLPTNRAIGARHRVRWCVALHRALISRISAITGNGAPPLVTGSYPNGAAQPANRISIQYLPAGFAAQHGVTESAFAILIPAGADAAEIAPLALALTGLNWLTCGKGRARFHGDAVFADGHNFWPSPKNGGPRTWCTHTVAVPETVPQRADGPWSLNDAARLSIALVWRDYMGIPRRGRDWYPKMAAQTQKHGVDVTKARLLRRSDISHWVHKVPKNVIVQPYTTAVQLGALANNTTLVAIGQSRHLGGGLLVPADLPYLVEDIQL